MDANCWNVCNQPREKERKQKDRLKGKTSTLGRKTVGAIARNPTPKEANNQ